MEGDLLFAPGFVAPPNTDYKSYHEYIDDLLPSESPTLYGLHSNAEIGTLSTRSSTLPNISIRLNGSGTLSRISSKACLT